ncbi:MAG: DNA/RNA nuclease SfsA [Limnochordia bacterium]|jgi:sugar fermentation stimulation protein A
MEFVTTAKGIKFNGLVRGTWEKRNNRFSCSVTVGGMSQLAHLPSSGRMEELLIPGVDCWLVPRSGNRKTAFDLLLVRHGDGWVSVDARLPNRLVEIWLEQGIISLPGAYSDFRREYSHGDSRYDFFLTGEGDCLMEVKSVTLVEDGVAKFPDAPTARGTKHVQGLIEAKKQGWAGAIIFVIQREDGRLFQPNYRQDPQFAQALVEAHRAGITILAYSCETQPEGIEYKREVPVDLGT